MLAIGLDIGTTGLSALLIDGESGEVCRCVTKPNSFFIVSEHPWEKAQDAQKIFLAVKAMLDELMCDGVACIGVTGQMHGIVYLDSDGEVLSPLYTWQDARGDLPYENSTYAKAFGAPSGYGLTTDFYNRVNNLVPPRAAALCTVHDFVAMRLAGRNSPVVHASDAASLGHYDIEKGRFTIDNPLLPEVTKGVKIIGAYNGVPVCTAIGDNQAGVIGSVPYKNGVLVNVGTGSQVSVCCEAYKKADGLETRPLDGDECILVGSSLCGGRAFAMLERFFASAVSLYTGEDVSMYAPLDKLLGEDTHTTLKFDTRFCGTRENPDIRACVSNLSQDNFTVKDFALSLLHGMADELYGFFEKAGSQAAAMCGSGNGIRRNPTLKKILEATFGMEMNVPAHREEAAYGAALSALYASGKYPTLAKARELIRFEKHSKESTD